MQTFYLSSFLFANYKKNSFREIRSRRNLNENSMESVFLPPVQTIVGAFVIFFP